VTFDYLGDGSPGEQVFEVVDPVTFATLDSDTTTLIPLPATAWLLGASLIGAAARTRRRIRKT
jgi:hypothetical protein